MIRNFLKEIRTQDRTEAFEIDTNTGRVKIYQINNGSANCGIDFPFSEYDTTVYEMGYASPDECIKTLKKRGNLGKEVSHEEQAKAELNAYKKLLEWRRGNGWSLLDIPEKIAKYY